MINKVFFISLIIFLLISYPVYADTFQDIGNFFSSIFNSIISFFNNVGSLFFPKTQSSGGGGGGGGPSGPPSCSGSLSLSLTGKDTCSITATITASYCDNKSYEIRNGGSKCSGTVSGNSSTLNCNWQVTSGTNSYNLYIDNSLKTSKSVTCSASPPPKCSDGTLYSQCSSTKPKYCDNGNLVNKCSVCGCASGTCQADGTCLVSVDEHYFTLHYATVAANVLKPGTKYYQPHWATLARNLGLNAFRINEGGEGEVWGTNMVANAANDAWADNLNAMLATISSEGFTGFYHELGNPWGGMFGIRDPEGSTSDGYDMSNVMDINVAKTYIDKLAGNNKLGHNFITDPRYTMWDISNEAVIGTVNADDTVTPSPAYYWTIQMADYIRSKGGKVVVPSPRVIHNGNTWEQAFRYTVPLLEGHVDYLERHEYGCYELYHNFNLGNGNYNWDAWEAWYISVLQELVISRGSFDIEDIILGEFGIWTGTGTDVGLSGVTFTDQNRIDYYTHMFEALKSVGIRNAGFHYAFNEGAYNSEAARFGMIAMAPSETMLPGSEIIKANYESQ